MDPAEHCPADPHPPRYEFLTNFGISASLWRRIKTHRNAPPKVGQIRSRFREADQALFLGLARRPLTGRTQIDSRPHQQRDNDVSRVSAEEDPVAPNGYAKPFKLFTFSPL